MTNRNQTDRSRICVTITKQDHERLACMARETGRTVPGYIRWLLHRHFREQNDLENHK